MHTPRQLGENHCFLFGTSKVVAREEQEDEDDEEPMDDKRSGADRKIGVLLFYRFMIPTVD